MTSVLPVSALTIRDLFRRRIFVILWLFGGLLVLLSFPLRQLTIGQWARLITDVGFGATDLCATFLAIFLGATLVAGDLDRRTLYPLLAKPLGRPAFVVGKFLGLATVLAALIATMTVGIVAMLLLARQKLALETGAIPQTAFAMMLHAWLCGGLALMFSSFTSVTLSAIFGFAVALLGHTLDNLVYFAEKSHSATGKILLGVTKILPNLSLLDLKTLAAHQKTIPWGDLLARSGYALAYTAALVALGAAIFSRRDLK